MAEVKWIKMATNIFDNRKIRQIECLPEGNAIIVTWLKLLCLAGSINDGGYIYFTKEIPYTEQMLSTQFNMPVSTIQLAFHTFEQFEMVEVVDDILHISNWEKYQNIEGMEKIREQTRKRVARHREKQKLLQTKECNDTVTQCNATEEDKDKEEDKEIKEKEKENPSCQMIADQFNQICKSYPKIKSLSDARKKSIKARLKTYSPDDFIRLFEKAEASDFLKGKNNRDWSATFDWMIKDSNMAKILDGNYDNKAAMTKNHGFTSFEQNQYDFDEIERTMLSNNVN